MVNHREHGNRTNCLNSYVKFDKVFYITNELTRSCGENSSRSQTYATDLVKQFFWQEYYDFCNQL